MRIRNRVVEINILNRRDKHLGIFLFSESQLLLCESCVFTIRFFSDKINKRIVKRGSFMQYLKDEVKNRIKTVAMKEFQDKGFLHASIRDISKNAGVAIGNVYRYFKSKEDLFNEIVEPAYQRFFGMEKIYKREIYSKVSFFEEIVNYIMEIMKEYKIQVLIMVDKSKGTKYASFKEELIRLAEKGLKDNLWSELQKRGIEIKDPFIFYVIASTFTEGLFIILRKYDDGEETRYLIHQLMILHFDDLDKRFE